MHLGLQNLLLAYQTFQVEDTIDVIDNSIQGTRPDLLLLKEFTAINPIGTANRDDAHYCHSYRSN